MIKDLLRASGIHFFGLTANKVLGVVVFLLFARALAPQAFGQVVLFTTVVTMVTVLAEAGLGTWLQTQSAKSDHLQTLKELSSTRLVTFFISAILLAIVGWQFRAFSDTVAGLLIVSLFFEAFIALGDSYYLATHQVSKIALKNLSRVIMVLIGYVWAHSWLSAEVTMMIMTAAAGLTMAWYYPLRAFSLASFSAITKHFTNLKKAAPYSLLMVTSLTYARGDSLLVQYFAGSGALGLYGVAYRYLEGISLLPTAVFQILFPRAAQATRLAATQLRMITFTMGVLGLLTGTALFIAGPFLTSGLLGDSYAGAFPIIQVLSGVVVLFFLNAPLSAVVQSSSLVKKFLPFGIGNTVLNIGLNCMLIPMLGPIGAAWAMLSTEFTGFLINLYFAQQLYESKS
jgi:O-antigen/teichoic acid export membrane protein